MHSPAKVHLDEAAYLFGLPSPIGNGNHTTRKSLYKAAKITVRKWRLFEVVLSS
jgi:hypothetical protein